MDKLTNDQRSNYQQTDSKPYVVNNYQNNNETRPTSVGDWILTLIITGLPVIGFICLLIWAFSSGTSISKKNWAKANLIVMLIFSAITIFILIMFGGVILAAIRNSSTNQYY